ncbi:hypothetical protein BG005_002520 [Podila minutissima]|nr:hypothetical protein BG005_002520 [Podila minutissima]
MQAIDLRNSRFQTNTTRSIHTILEKAPGKVMLEYLMLDDVSGQPYVTDDAVTVKAEVMRYFTDARSDYSADVWDGLMMVPRTSEVNSAISSAPLCKAPGVSGVPGDLTKQLRSTAQSMFCILIQACIAQAKIPLSWTQGLIYCNAKGRVRSGRIREMRPINLLEYSHKILFTILTNGMVAIWKMHNILHGPNFSVLPGTITKTPIHILNSVMEDACEINKEAWILFQDMRRCFNSVSDGYEGDKDLGSWKHVNGHDGIRVRVREFKFVQALLHKSVTDVQAMYIVNNVLIPIILYQLTCTILSAHELKFLVGKYMSTIHQNVTMPASLPNSILFHCRLYGLHALTDVQNEEQVSMALL